MTAFLRTFWDRVAAWLLMGLGALCLLLGWIGVSGTPYVESQIPYVVSGGLTGLGLIGIGATLWLSSDLRDEWHRLRGLEEAVWALVEQESVTSPTTELHPAAVPAKGGRARQPGPAAKSAVDPLQRNGATTPKRALGERGATPARSPNAAVSDAVTSVR